MATPSEALTLLTGLIGADRAAALLATNATAADKFATVSQASSPDASAVTVSPAVEGETDVQAMGEALAARVEVKTATHTLTAAEILAIGTTAVVLVAAQAGKSYNVIGSIIAFHPGATPYDISVGGSMDIGFGNPPIGDTYVWRVSDKSIFDGADPLVAYGNAASAGGYPIPLARALWVNQPLALLGDGSFTAGNGTADLIVWYLEIDVPA